MVAVAHPRLVRLPSVELRRRLQATLVLGEHVGSVDVRPTVVVDVRGVHPHRREADHRHLRVDVVEEGAVAAIDVEVVALEEVVRDVDVRTAVVVHVGDDDPESERHLRPVNSRRDADVGEVRAVVPVEAVAVAARLVARVAQSEGVRRAQRVVHDEEVEISVAVVVEERGLGGHPLIGDAVLLRLVLEHRHAVLDAAIDPELVRARRGLSLPGLADVDVEPAVAVHVGERDTSGPRPLGMRHARTPGDVAEREVPFVQIHARPVEIRREDDLGQTVAGEITDRHAAAVVEVAVGEDVEIGRRLEPVLEADARRAGGEAREELAAGLRQLAAARHAGRFRGARAGTEAEHQRPRRHERQPSEAWRHDHAAGKITSREAGGRRQPRFRDRRSRMGRRATRELHGRSRENRTVQLTESQKPVSSRDSASTAGWS